MKIFCLLALLIGLIEADSCKSQTIRSETSFPEKWDGGNPRDFNTSGDCTIEIEAPAGCYINMMYSIDFDTIKNVIVTNSEGNTVILVNGYNRQVYFYSTAKMKLTSNGAFSFKITFPTLNSLLDGTSTEVPVGSPFPFSFPNRISSSVFNSSAQVSVVPLETTGDVVVYDGIGSNGTYIGSFQDFRGKRKNFVSTSGVLTVFSMTDGVTLLVQNSEDVKGIASHYAVSEIDSSFGVTVDATGGTQALYLLKDTELYLNNVQMAQNNSTLTVYTGQFVANSTITRITSFRGVDDVSKQLPQIFQPSIQTYLLDQGSCILNFTTENWLSPNKRAFEGRKGVIYSLNYPNLDEKQNTSEIIYGDIDGVQQFWFNWKLRKLSPGHRVNITTFGESTTAQVATEAGQSGSALGGMFLVEFSSLIESQGFLLEYEIGTSGAALLTSILTLFVAFFHL